MTRRVVGLSALVIALSLVASTAPAQQEESYDYFAFNREMVQNGVQAILMCNGLFTSNRTLEQVFDQELAYLAPPRFSGPVGTARGGDYTVDWVHLKLNDQAQRTVLCKDPFKSRDERVERLIETL